MIHSFPQLRTFSGASRGLIFLSSDFNDSEEAGESELNAYSVRQMGTKSYGSSGRTTSQSCGGPPWIDMQRKTDAKKMHSVPYKPQMNGVVERFMRILGDIIRATLVGVDPWLWCYAAEYVGNAWNHLYKYGTENANEHPRLFERENRTPTPTPADRREAVGGSGLNGSYHEPTQQVEERFQTIA